MKRLLLTSSILAAGLGSAALAQAQPAPRETAGSSFCAAAYAPGPERPGEDAARSGFDAMDTDDDGFVSQAEYVACLDVAAGMESAEADRSAENMVEADADRSGAVELDEFMTAAETARHVATQVSKATDDPVLVFRRYVFVPVDASEVDVRGMSAFETSMRAELQFNALDTDGDDELSPEEWAQRSAKVPDRAEALAARFARLDEDGSGSLDELEFLEMFADAPDRPAQTSG